MVIGGIYHDEKTDEWAISFGNKLHFLFDGITDIDELIELGGDMNVKHRPELHLQLHKIDNEWRIKSDGSSENTIAAKGKYSDDFYESIKPYLKIFMK